jgi:hypothetical protein
VYRLARYLRVLDTAGAAPFDDLTSVMALAAASHSMYLAERDCPLGADLLLDYAEQLLNLRGAS